MKVLVTGAAGKLGRVACGILLDAGHDVLATDRRFRRNTPCPLELTELDVLSVYRLMRGVDAVVHLANYPISSDPDFTTTLTDNVTANINVFHVAADVGVGKIIHASSIQVANGTRRGEDLDRPSELAYLPLDGDLPPNPGTPYGLGKQVSETMLKFCADRHGLSAIALRLPLLMSESSRRRYRHPRPVPEEHLRHFHQVDEGFACITVDDAGRLIDACLRSDLPGYRCYLPAAPYNQLDWPVEKVIQTFYPNVPRRKPIDDATGLVDISRIIEETGWTPQDPPPWEQDG